MGIVELSARVTQRLLSSKVSLHSFELQGHINIGSQYFVSISKFVKLVKTLLVVLGRLLIAQPVF